MRYYLAQNISLKTTLTKEECLKLLRENTDQFYFKFWPINLVTKPFVCKFKGNRFRLYQRAYDESGIMQRFYGTVIAGDGGSRIEGSFGLTLFELLFAVIFGFIIAYVVFILSHEKAYRFLISLGFGVLPIAAIVFNYKNSTPQREIILVFLKKVLQASS